MSVFQAIQGGKQQHMVSNDLGLSPPWTVLRCHQCVWENDGVFTCSYYGRAAGSSDQLHRAGCLGALRFGKATHGYVIRNNDGLGSGSGKSDLETSLVNFYAKCGNVHLAERCFNSILQKDIVSWSSMIEAYSSHGYGREALVLFDQMLEEGVRPNGVTFLSLLSACSHSGLVSEARELFDCMTTKFGVSPELGHYTCMVDVLGRSGNLEEAVQVISDMKVKPDGRIWGALLASCKTHSNSKLAHFAAHKLMELEPDNVGYHVVFSNVQAGDGRWSNVEDIRRSMVDMNMQQCPAWSCVPETGNTLVSANRRG